jgi:hypothetical protein
LHAEEEDLRDQQFWAAKYQSPPPWIDPAMGMKQCFDAYLEAMIDDVPQFRRNILKRTLEELDWMVSQAKRAETMAQNTNIKVEAGLSDVLPAAEPPGMLPPAGAPSDIASQLGAGGNVIPFPGQESGGAVPGGI